MPAQAIDAEVAVGQLALRPPPPDRLDRNKSLRKGGVALGDNAHVLDFWSWAFSDLRQNNVRGHLAEYIVGLALNIQRAYAVLGMTTICWYQPGSWFEGLSACR